MKNILRSTTDLAMHFVSLYLNVGDIAVDATCGNGRDTVEMAKLRPGKLYGFDLQPEAIARTRKALADQGLLDETVVLINDGHENMGSYLKGEKVNAVIFNLGYLPSSSRTTATKAESTIRALECAIDLLDKDGLICITLYDGHEGGAEEKRAVLAFAKDLDQRIYHVSYLNMINQSNHPPEIVLITKKLKPCNRSLRFLHGLKAADAK